MKKQKQLFKVVTSALLTLCMTVAPLVGGLTNVAAYAETPALSEVGLEKVPDPIDPQSWQLHREMNWDNLKPNPVINWMTEHNPDSLYNPSRGAEERRNSKINGAIILVDFWDRPFLMLGDKGSDLFGFYCYNEDGTVQTEKTYNPMITVDSEEELKDFWVNYLNKQIDENHGLSIDELWRENSFGKWGVDLSAFGVYHLQGFEMEYGMSYMNWRDIPPAFRRGAETGASNTRSLISESLNLAYADDVYAGDYDFFFICHSGYDQSGVWLEFGQMQWVNGEDVPYEYGVRAKMDEIEKILTENPLYLISLDERGGYNQTTTIHDAAEKVREILAGDKNFDNWEFKFPAAERTWANNYIGQGTSSTLTGTNGGHNTGPTRYVKWTSWAAATTKWASSSGYSGTTVRNSKGQNVTRPYSQQAECNGMATYAHEFGHVVNLSDNYDNPWSTTRSPLSEPWDLMARGCFAGPFGDHARWSVPGGLEADSCPVHMMVDAKKRSGFYDDGDLLALTVAELKAKTPVVANVVSRNIPLNNLKDAAHPDGYYPWLEEYGLVKPNYYKAIELTFDSANPDVAPLVTTGFTDTAFRANRIIAEVVDQSGYDSYNHDHGVILSRQASGQQHQVIDSHLYDIAMIDYELNGEYRAYPLAHATQQADAAFHAGISTVDTGYYATQYGAKTGNNPAAWEITKPGSIVQWEEQDGRDIVSGSTVNEWEDTANKLHFYILDKNLTQGKYGDFLSYQIGFLRTDGVPVNGEIIVEKGKLAPATAGRVAVQEFNITNTGDATDIVRIKLGGTLNYKTTILNNLYAIGAGETITVPVYIEVPEAVGFAAASVPTVTLTSLSDADLTLTASSESNAAKTSTATVGDAANQSTVNRLIVTTDKAIVSTNEYFNVNVKFAEKVSSNTAILTYTFDTDKFEYRGLGLAPGVKALNTVVNGGTLKITVMVDDYDTLDYGNVLFSANGNIDLTNKANEILVNIQCVEKDANGVKTIKGADGGTVQLTGLQGDTNGDGKVDLIDLSNMIDWYGFNTKTPDWETKYVFYDFNRTGEIDISDVTKVAQLINL